MEALNKNNHLTSKCWIKVYVGQCNIEERLENWSSRCRVLFLNLSFSNHTGSCVCVHWGFIFLGLERFENERQAFCSDPNVSWRGWFIPLSTFYVLLQALDLIFKTWKKCIHYMQLYHIHKDTLVSPFITQTQKTNTNEFIASVFISSLLFCLGIL